MSDTTTTLLNNAVSYDWEELKKFAREGGVHAAMPVVTSAPTPSPVVQTLLNTDQLETFKKKVAQEICAHLVEEIDLVVELALKKTRAHLRSDLERTIALNVDRAVRDSFIGKPGA